MRNIMFLGMLFLTFGANAQEVKMNASEISSFKNQIKEVSEKTKTITSDFIQYKHLDFLTEDIKTSGKMTFKAPNWVKWEYTKPYQYSVIFKDNVLLINDGGTKSDVKISSSKLFKQLNKLIINSVTGDMFDEEQFDILYSKTENYNKVILTSKDKNFAKFIKTFELHFNKKTGAVIEVKMIEPSEDFTKIIFSNRVDNSTLSDAIFTN
ncbi:MAG: outer membrane lipoprotein carrier protein LolA [Flavobacteriaceae bacterium]|nr:outer membrane lipoprotein carrier protein LolA [Flavobacteriaceae bacterium]